MNFRVMLLIIFGLFSVNSYAHISSDGDQFTTEYNQNGAVLTSVYPKIFWVRMGANLKSVEKKVTIYIGKNCDVFSDFYGKGSWEWANGGFFLSFEKNNKILSFGRQELSIDNNGACSM